MRRHLFILAVLGALLAPGAAHADAVTQWNLNASNAIFGVAAQPPQASVPHLAMVHGAVYDAVNAIDGGHEPYLLNSRLASPFDSKDAAVAAAAHRMLLSIVPAQQPALDPQYTPRWPRFPDGSQKTRGIAVGEAAAAAMIAARTNDGRFGSFRFSIGTTPGAWRPILPLFVNDPNAWLKDVKPFLIESSSQFRSKGPLALTSHQYATRVRRGQVARLRRRARPGPRIRRFAARYWAENPPAPGAGSSARCRRSRDCPRRTMRGCSRWSTCPPRTR